MARSIKTRFQEESDEHAPGGHAKRLVTNTRIKYSETKRVGFALSLGGFTFFFSDYVRITKILFALAAKLLRRNIPHLISFIGVATGTGRTVKTGK